MAFVELVDKGASPVAFKKTLGLNQDEIAKHMGDIVKYRELVSIYKEIKDLTQKRREATNGKEKLEIHLQIQNLTQKLKEMQ